MKTVILRMCTQCLVIQPVSEFSKHPRGRDGLQSACRSCNRAFCRRRRAQFKQAVFDYYGAWCACCGEDEVRFLTLDHVNNDGAEHRRSLGAHRGGTSTDIVYRNLVNGGFADAIRFQILCYNCNCGKRDNGGICPHKEH